MKKIHCLILVFALLLVRPLCRAQSTELGITGGVMDYYGELNPHLFTTDLTVYHPAGGVFLRRNWNSHYSFRINALYGRISGNDAHLTSAYAQSRNLSFSSPIVELSGLFEFNFFPFEKYGSPYRMTPYVFTGLSLFYFNPSMILNDEKINLESMQLEGTSYSLIQAGLPMGIGFKARLSGWSLGLEIGPRKTSTDYLDNTSKTYLDYNSYKEPATTLADPSGDTDKNSLGGRQRGNSKDKDWYMFIGLSISHKVGTDRKHECDRLLKNQ